MPPKRSGSLLTSSNQQQQQDQVHVYEVEGTPGDLSEGTSFSDLTIDDAQGSGRVSVDSNDGLIQHHVEGGFQEPHR